MKTDFVVLLPKEASMTLASFDGLSAAKRAVGLNKVDFGIVKDGLSIVVDEFGLLSPCKFGYCSINGQLYAGKAIIHGYNPFDGNTVSVTHGQLQWLKEHTTCYANAETVEAHIANGRVRRPTVGVNGQILSEWRSGVMMNPLLN